MLKPRSRCLPCRSCARPCKKSDQTIVMKSGRYTLTDLPDGSRDFPCSGSNNTIDLSDVHVTVPVGTTRRSYITISGNNNVFRGGTFEDTYQNGLREVTDFSAYNQNRSTLAKGLSGSAVLSITGDNNRVADTKLTIRGSFPYGYGSMYGIGGDNVYGLDKRCGILVKGETQYHRRLRDSSKGPLAMASTCRAQPTKRL